MQPQRLDLEYHIVWQGRWHVGSGYQSAATNRLLHRMGGVDGSPFVPGFSNQGCFCAINANGLLLPCVLKQLTHTLGLKKTTRS